jgi:hypothetical protein
MPELPYGATPVPATPIGELKRWRLDIRCGKCREVKALPLEFVAERYGRDIRIADVIRRLRCARERHGGRCGAKPGFVALVEFSVYGSSVRNIREIVVIDEARRP